MKKIIKKYGDSLVLIFTKEDRDVYDIKVGNIVLIDENQFQMKSKSKEDLIFKRDSKHRVERRLLKK
jgi:hypothetical protein